MPSSIQVSGRLRKRLARQKRHARQSYEEVIEAALDAADAVRVPAILPVGGLPAEVAAAVGDVRRALVAAYGERIVRIVLYGSYARHDARPGSDVDLLLVLRGELDRARELARVVESTYDVLLERGVHVSVLPMSEEDFLTRATPLLLNVRREGIPL
jgi:predicted nucleotidyltransferase